ncbi:chalcone isomerase family protein [Pseudomonas gingeri]|uniref:Chalcone isomerase family protein n=1 Tax=Pseudomonas gingeri TaxID=117681 RepID=A0A7Y7XAM9_9PSED|nr:chalcone isomerase family protein [Pseudomonas gingeri]NWA26086.1 chalcone isomerase family protein [Pseudomonas gingeri]NWB95262.1 chalcone isomerase family protein [Pseudomonas gingeri]NWD78645.1 chalcone isomerase family protein [Pseudomonas gingeri]
MRQIIACLLLIFSSLSWAGSAERLKEAHFPGQWHNGSETLELKGQSVLTYLWADVYAAALYTAPGVSARQAVAELRDQRLELYYFRAIDRSDVIKAATATLQRQQTAANLVRLQGELDALHQSFKDIQQGDRYALDYRVGQGLSLERNGQVIFSSRDPELARAYFGIWLAPQGLSDPLRETLLAQNPS